MTLHQNSHVSSFLFSATAFLMLATLLFLTGCGGGGGGGGITTPNDKSLAVRTEFSGSSAATDALIAAECGTAGGVVVFSGIDTNGNGVLDPDEENETPQIVCDGTNENDGLDGLVRIDHLPAGSNGCINGGVAIYHGLDANRNGILDTEEQNDTPTIVCNGIDCDCPPKVPPILLDTALHMMENAPEGTVAGSLTILSQGDSDITAITLEGEDAERFRVETNGTVSLAPGGALDRETKYVYEFTAVATSEVGDGNRVDLTIRVDDYIDPLLVAKRHFDNSKPEFRYPYSIAAGDNYIAIGDDYNETVYLYKKDSDNNLIFIAEIQPDDVKENGFFGHSLSIHGNYLAVGAGNDGWEQEGAIYLFRIESNESVTQLAKIKSEDINSMDLFGISIAMDGDYIAVGAQAKDAAAGAAYLFKRHADNNITQIAKLEADDRWDTDLFGRSIDINSEYIAVGAPSKDTTSDNAGAVYLFKRHSDDSVTQIAKLVGDAVAEDEHFGASVSLKDNYLVVGTDGTASHTAYLFRIDSDDADGVVKTAVIHNDDYEAEWWFGGYQVKMEGDHIAVSYYGDPGCRYIEIYRKNADDSVTHVKQIEALIGTTGALEISAFDYHNEHIALAVAEHDGIDGKFGSLQLFDTEPEDRPYIIDDISHLEVTENNSSAFHRFHATSINGEPFIYTLVGPDGSHFTMHDDAIAAIEPLDFENPVDTDGDNNYSVVVTVSDANSQIFSYPSTISVLDEYSQIQKFQASDIQENDQFGTAIAASGNLLAIGANRLGVNRAAYLYRIESENNILEIAKLMPQSGEGNDYFGNSVAIDGDYIVIGASNTDYSGIPDAGAAYLFKRQADDTVTKIARLNANEPHIDFLGTSVAIDGDYISAGAPLEDDLGDIRDRGAVYIFKRHSDTTASQIAKIRSGIYYQYEYFGQSVAMKNDYIVAGSPGYEAISIFKGYYSNNIHRTQILQANDHYFGANFGQVVSFDGDYIAIGAPDDTERGAVYLFERQTNDSFIQVAKLRASDGETGDKFGSAVTINGNYVVVGAYNEDDNGGDAGAAYIFKRQNDNSFKEIEKIAANDSKAKDHFGQTVAISDDFIIIGAPGEDTGATDAGAVYLFEY